MAGKAHQQHIDMMNAFDTADRNTPRDKTGRASYGMGAGGMPRTAAQQSSVKKAAAKSAAVRGAAKASAGGPPRTPAAPATPGPGLATGGISLVKPKKGLLSL